MAKPRRRCKDCHAPVRLSHGVYFHADVPQGLETIARETEPTPKPETKTADTKGRT